MKIIDFEKHGDLVRFYLGKDDCNDYWGDDWNDTPYEHNAGPVYEEYVADYVDYLFPFNGLILEPCDGEYNSPWSKEDMKKQRVPCIVAVPEHLAKETWQTSFSDWKGSKANGVLKFYFEDRMEVPPDHFVNLNV